jgi:hypothetical protein
LILENQVHHQNHHCNEQYRHNPACPHEIRYPIARRPHDECIDLMGRDEERIGCDDGNGKSEYGRVGACADGYVYRQRD